MPPCSFVGASDRRRGRLEGASATAALAAALAARWALCPRAEASRGCRGARSRARVIVQAKADVRIEQASSASDVRAAADIAVRSLRWTKDWLDTPNFTEDDYELLAGHEEKAYQKLYLATKSQPSVLLVAKEAPTGLEPAGDSGGSGRIVGCVACEVRCFDTTSGQQVDVKFYDYGKRHVLRPVLADLAVSPESRGAGVARKLVDRVEALAAEWGYQEVILLVEATNFQARGFYDRLGYRLHGILPSTKTSYLEKGGGESFITDRRTLALVLRKSLKPFPVGALENFNWGFYLAVLTTLGVLGPGVWQDGLALLAAPP